MKTIMQPSFVPSKRKYLFCGDRVGMGILEPVMKIVDKEHLPSQFVLVEDKEKADISCWLKNQKMGSYLYIAVEWSRLPDLKRMAEVSGFSDDEAQYIGHGVRFINVYCCKCQKKTKVNGELPDAFTICPHCHLKLSVSDHYSKRMESYLGYPALIRLE